MRLRTIRRVTQRELADALGVTEHTVSNWESGRSVPKLTPKQYLILLKILKISPEELPEDFGPQPVHTHDPVAKITTYPD